MKRQVWHPGLNRNIVIGGCKLPKHDPVGLKLKDFLHLAYPPAPATIDYSAKALSVIENIEGNDTLGDCVIAEDAHFIGVVTGNANTLFSYSSSQVISDYSKIAGYIPGEPATDQGTDPTTDLNYRVKVGYADGSKDAGWALVDATNQGEVEYAINTFGNLKMWFGIPDSIVNSMPSSSGFVWDVTAGSPDQNNGHCIGSPGYNVPKILTVPITAQGVGVMTWGMLGLVTWKALASWFVPSAGGGLAVRVTTDWLNKTSGVAPSGLNLQALVTGFNSYFDGSIPVPIPTPAPAPTPSPAPGPLVVTLAEAQSWATAGIGGGFPLLTRAQAEADASAGLAANWPKS